MSADRLLAMIPILRHESLTLVEKTMPEVESDAGSHPGLLANTQKAHDFHGLFYAQMMLRLGHLLLENDTIKRRQKAPFD